MKDTSIRGSTVREAPTNFVRRQVIFPGTNYNFCQKLLGRFDHEQNFRKILFILSINIPS